MSLPHLAHVAMPFALSGSAVTNVVRHLCREHTALGGHSSVVLSDNRNTVVHDAENVYVDHRRYCPRTWFTPVEMQLDHLAGLAGLDRPYTSRLPIPGIEALVTRRPDVVLVHEGHYASSALPRWRRALPDSLIGLYVHTSLSRAYGTRELRRLLGHADVIVTVSQFMADRLLARVPSLDVPVRSVLNGTEPDPPVPASIGTDDSGPEGLRVLFYGQIAAHKGPDVMVRAVATLLDEGLPVSARIVGSSVHGTAADTTPYERELRDIAAPYGERIQFLPFLARQELAAQRRWASVICVPSQFDDPCPLVLLESMSTGRAIVASRRGGIPEIGQGAVRYIDPCTAETMVTALRALLEQPGELTRLAGASAVRAAELSWATQHRRLLDVLAAAAR